MIKRLLSFLLPVKIHQKKSVYSKNLEVTWNNGYLVLDSENTNYSFGSLQRVLKKGLKYIGYERIQNFNSILVLGVAGGSVIETLKKEVKFEGKITGVEIDAAVVELATKYFGLGKHDNVSIVIDDAFEFVLKTKEKYDLIIIDIFQDTIMPNFLFETFFINRVCSLLKSHGFILFNTMLLNESQNLRNKKYVLEFYEDQFQIKTIPRVEVHNELILIEKLS